jgi:glucokinase
MVFTPSEQVTQTLASWKAAVKDAPFHVLVGIDVGATNVRVGLARPGNAVDYVELFRTSENRASVVLAIFAEIGSWLAKEFGAVVLGASVACAGPVDASRSKVVMTNYDPKDKVFALPFPDALCPAGRTYLLNDLEASCYGVLSLSAEKRLNSYFNTLWGPDDVTLTPTHHLVRARGTGLGVGLLLWCRSHFRVVPLEIGHTIATEFGPHYPHVAEDAGLMAYLSKLVYGLDHLIEVEDVCSGRGLLWVYQYLTLGVKDALPLSSPKEVAVAAGAGKDPYAVQALYTHYKFLFRAAQNTCVALQAKGVLLVGDNQVANNSFVEAKKGELKVEFLNHPKHGWIENVPFFQQTSEVNTGMLGAFFVAADPSVLA